MLELIKFLNSDIVKKLGAALGLVAGGVLQLVPNHTIAYKVAGFILGILSPLGLISGGTTGAQPQREVAQEIEKSLAAGG